MCRDLTTWRSYSSLRGLNAQGLQATAKRVALAFSAFFRRLAAGDKPGYPRFKTVRRFPGWGYKTHGDGWRLMPGENGHGTVRLSGIGVLKLRGKGRFAGTAKTAEVLRSHGKWYLSTTFDVEPAAVARTTGTGTAAFDWGLSTLLAIAHPDGSAETVDNPRWLKRKLDALKDVQRAVSLEENRIRVKLSLPERAVLKRHQRTGKLNRLSRQLGALHGKISRQRRDFYHKLTTRLVGRYGPLATEQLDVAGMVQTEKSGPVNRKGLNRGILDAAPSMMLGMLRTKAAEAASVFVEADTRSIKPTQRCHVCGALVKKTLCERTHRCSCGCISGRDENAAKTLLRWFLEGDFWLGTSQGTAVTPARETPSIAASAVWRE
jgi:putative transposase